MENSFNMDSGFETIHVCIRYIKKHANIHVRK